MNINENTVLFLDHTHKVQPHECGPDGKIRLQGVLDYFQDIAANHADLLGVGLEEMLRLQQIWVLSRLKVKIDALPSLGEHLTIRTYPSGVNKLFATRQYQILSEKGESLCEASSYWLMLDPVKLRVVRPFRELTEFALLNRDRSVFFPEIGKIEERSSAGKVVTDYTVRHTHIDLNGHLNNAFYGTFTEDTLGVLAGKAVRPAEIQINFLQSCALHTKVECSGSLGEDGSFYVEGRNAENGQKCFQAEGTL